MAAKTEDYELQSVVTESVVLDPKSEYNQSPALNLESSQSNLLQNVEEVDTRSNAAAATRSAIKEEGSRLVDLLFKKNKDEKESAGSSSVDKKKDPLTEWEELNENVVLLIDCNQSETAWLEELASLQHIKVHKLN